MTYDLTGKRFGNLLVLNKTLNPKNKKKQTYWNCVCNCGNAKIASTNELTSGRVYQCKNCGDKQGRMSRRKNVVGLKIGCLFVKEEIVQDGKDSLLVCECECGNEVLINRESLIYNKAKKYPFCCDECLKEYKHKEIKNKYVGNKYGRLKILDIIWETNTRMKALCRCDCGNIKLIDKEDVVGGHTLSCGCYQKESLSGLYHYDYDDYISDSGVSLIKETVKNKHNQQLWLCRCFCGNYFEELPAKIRNNSVQSCGCYRKSFGEKHIEKILSNADVNYKPQFSFPDCKYKMPLYFDFVIFDDNDKVVCAIEYDGLQHYKPIDFFGGEEGFNLTQKRDLIKSDYCKAHNIPLYRFSYNQTNDEIKEQLVNIINP